MDKPDHIKSELCCSLTPPTKHYHLSTFNYADYEMKAVVFAGEDKEDIMKSKKMGFLIISHLLKLSRTKAQRFDHLAHSL